MSRNYDIEFEEVKKCSWIVSSFKDFSKDAEAWRDAYFTLLSWKNTWGIPYKMDIESNGNHIPYLIMIVDEKNADSTVSMLEDYGYGNIQVSETWIVKATNFDERFDWLIAD